MEKDSPLPFDPLIARWFADRYGSPTDIQRRTWQAVAAGEHALITAPTGSGKTLAAFLWALDRLITGAWPAGRLRVLYVSPLKALNNDIRRNLMEPLARLREVFGHDQRPFPAIQVQTRSGDTPSTERRRMIRRPPEILITTPESLNLLLSSRSGRSMLGRLNTVILDEIHAIMDSRRGTYLLTAVERLVRLSGEFQRIALSATITPVEAAAEMVGGYRLVPGHDPPQYRPRKVTVLASDADKRYDLSIRRPRVPEGPRDPNDFWGVYADRLRDHIRCNRSTLIFTNSRRLCEKLTYLINSDLRSDHRELTAYSHHGALSREIRTEVETHLKAGRLKAIVATGSLELGIDIGALDEVILVQSPWTVSEAVQRVGRAGHGVGRISRGTFYPTHALDTVSAVVIATAAARGDIERLSPPDAPLDVLAQVLVSMAAFEPWQPDDLFHFIRTAAPYRHLSRRRFNLVLEMLEGRYRQTRIRELQPRISHDRLDRRITARKGAVLALYASGGVIPDRGYYTLRLAHSAAIVGELDEEFVWEARVGQEFTLGAQNWRIRQITHSDVLVDTAPPGGTVPPFWRAEAHNRSFHLSEKIAAFMEKADASLDRPGFVRELMSRWLLDEAGAEQLADELRRQRVHTGCPLPHRRHLVLEDTVLGAGADAGRLIVWHTLWGGRVNRPLAMALEAAWEERFGSALQVFATNDALTFLLTNDVSVEGITDLVRADTLDTLLRRRLPGTGFFGARFRECAGRALLLPRHRFDRRMPLWLTRRRAQHLLAAVADQGDFPIVLETWRTCLQDEFNLHALRQLLEELESGSITWSYARTPYPSPFARNSTWQQTNQDMYADDTPVPGRAGGLLSDLLYEVTLEPGLRPVIPEAQVRAFEAKRQRLADGYAPDASEELLDWIKERVSLPWSEWQALLAAVDRDHQLGADQVTGTLGAKLVVLQPDAPAAGPMIIARELLDDIIMAFYATAGRPPVCTLLSGEPVILPVPTQPGDADQAEPTELALGLFEQWLRFYGPHNVAEIAAMLGIPLAALIPVIDALDTSQTIISGNLVEGGGPEDICDRENFEILLRISRKSAMPAFTALDSRFLPLFIARHQGVARNPEEEENPSVRLNQLLGWPAAAALWETEILPARLKGYRPEQWDPMMQAMQSEGLRWIGQPGRKVLFCYEDELDLIETDEPDAEESRSSPATDLEALFPPGNGRYPFSVLKETSGLSPDVLNKRLWDLVWRGRITNDTLAALRRGVAAGFKLPDRPDRSPAFHGRRRGRSMYRRRSRALVDLGNWFRLTYPDPPGDLLEQEELVKERVRLLLDRYGLVCRELVSRELPVMGWRAVFRSLRLMELSGEVLAGHFFDGIPGLQFMSPQAFQQLAPTMPEDDVFWLNAADPASLCGLGIQPLQEALPRRLPGTHLVYHGTRLVLVSHQTGKRLDIRVPADDPHLGDYFGFMHHLLARAVLPPRSVVIETINGVPAPDQPAFAAALAQWFEVVADPKSLTVYLRH